MKKRSIILSIIIFFVGVLGVYIVVKQLPTQDRTIINTISIYGTYASIFGLIIACVQIFSIKKISEITKNEVNLTQRRISQIVSVSELSKANKIVQEIQNFISTDKHELGLLRMRDLKEIVIQSKCSSDLHKLTETPEYNEIIQKLSEDLNNMSEFVRNKKKINFSIINKNLESISTTILNYENNIKSNGYDK